MSVEDPQPGEWFNDGQQNYMWDGNRLMTEAEVQAAVDVQQAAERDFAPEGAAAAARAAELEARAKAEFDALVDRRIDERDAAEAADFASFRTPDAHALGAADGGGAEKFTRERTPSLDSAVAGLAARLRR